MKKRIIMAFIASMLVFTGKAQTKDKELNSLVGLVEQLRDGRSDSYSRVQEMLKADSKWTPMNETGTLKEQECKPSEITKRFKLNRILSKVDNDRKYVATHGDMLNGEDERYNYSLYERSVKAKASVSYTLKGREGKQTFVVVPYLANNSGLTATIRIANGSTAKFQKQANGTLVYTSNYASTERNDVITITVTNASSSNQAFVLLNHNSRNK